MTGLPRLYAIIDRGLLPPAISIGDFAEELLKAGVTLMQYRNKQGSSREMLSDARELRRMAYASGGNVRLVMNDRFDLTLAAGFDGVHLGQDDLTAEDARRVCGPEIMIGVSTHNREQFEAAAAGPTDYIAIGPIFATRSKARPDPVVGLEGLRTVRTLTRKPVVAIGGITRGNCKAVLDAGADAVAVIGDLLGDPSAHSEGELRGKARKSAEDFLRLLE